MSDLRQLQHVAELVARHPKARPLLESAERFAMEPPVAAPAPAPFPAPVRPAVEPAIAGPDQGAAFAALLTEATRAMGGIDQRLSHLESRKHALAAGYTDEGLTALEAWMAQRGTTDHASAMLAFERENPPPEPLMTGGPRWDFRAPPLDEPVSLKPLFDGNDEGFLNHAIGAALRDVRGR